MKPIPHRTMVFMLILAIIPVFLLGCYLVTLHLTFLKCAVILLTIYIVAWIIYVRRTNRTWYKATVTSAHECHLSPIGQSNRITPALPEHFNHNEIVSGRDIFFSDGHYRKKRMA